MEERILAFEADYRRGASDLVSIGMMVPTLRAGAIIRALSGGAVAGLRAARLP